MAASVPSHTVADLSYLLSHTAQNARCGGRADHTPDPRTRDDIHRGWFTTKQSAGCAAVVPPPGEASTAPWT